MGIKWRSFILQARHNTVSLHILFFRSPSLSPQVRHRNNTGLLLLFVFIIVFFFIVIIEEQDQRQDLCSISRESVGRKGR